jgi:hypothetical protein
VRAAASVGGRFRESCGLSERRWWTKRRSRPSAKARERATTSTGSHGGGQHRRWWTATSKRRPLDGQPWRWTAQAVVDSHMQATASTGNPPDGQCTCCGVQYCLQGERVVMFSSPLSSDAKSIACLSHMLESCIWMHGDP